MTAKTAVWLLELLTTAKLCLLKLLMAAKTMSAKIFGPQVIKLRYIMYDKITACVLPPYVSILELCIGGLRSNWFLHRRLQHESLLVKLVF